MIKGSSKTTNLRWTVVGATALSFLLGGPAVAQVSPSERTPGELDMTGQAGNPPKEYIVLPVPRGDLKVAEGHSLKDSTVKGANGKKLGTLERLIMDAKTGHVEYGVLSLDDTGRLVPLAWSAFNVDRKSGEVTLNATEDQLKPTVNPELTKNIAPEVQDLVSKSLKTIRGEGESSPGKKSGK